MALTRKLGRRLLVAAAFCLIAGIFFYLTQDFLSEQFRAYILGSIEIEAEKTGLYLPEVDEVEVISLGDLKHNGQGFVEGRISDYNILGQTVLRGDDAKKASELWRWIPRGRQYMDLCFQPAYALRFKKDNKLLLETSVCWGCHIYTLPFGPFGRWGCTTEYGFDADSKNAQELLNLLKQKLPPPEAPSKK